MKLKGGVEFILSKVKGLFYLERSRKALSLSPVLSLSKGSLHKPVVFVISTLLFFGLFFGILFFIPKLEKSSAAGTTVTISDSGGTRNWNDTASWVGGVVPTVDDDVVATATSGSLVVNVATAALRSFDLTGYAATLSGASNITVAGSAGLTTNVIFAGTQTWTGTLLLNPPATATINLTMGTLTTSGTCGGITIAGTTTGAVVLQDALTMGATKVLTLTSGTLNTNNQAVSVGNLSWYNTNTKTLTLGASAITITGGRNVLGNTVLGNPWGTTVTSSTATITLTAVDATLNVAQNMNGLSLVFTGGGTVGYLALNGGTFNNITVIGTANVSNIERFNNTSSGPLITGTLTLSGNSPTNRLFVSSNILGTPLTITAANVALSNTDFRDITFAGAMAGTASSTSIGDCGGNSGVNWNTTAFPTASALQTVTGNSALWSAATWAGRDTNPPLPQDSVNINMTAGQTLTVDMPRIGGGGASGIYFTTATKLTLGIGVTSYGSVNFTNAGIFASSANAWTFESQARSGTLALTSNSRAIYNINVQVVGAILQLQDDFSILQALIINNGMFDANNKNVTVVVASLKSGTTTMMGSGTWTLNGTGNVFQNAGTINANTSTIAITNTSSSAKNFIGGGLTYNNISITGGGTGAVIFTGSNTFNNFTIGAPKTVTFPSGVTTTINGTFTAVGTVGNIITLKSSIAGSAATLNKPNGVRVASDYLDITAINVTPEATWYYGNNSVWHSGAGWNAGVPPAPTIPDAPTIGTATSGNAFAVVTFAAPANGGGSPITGYTVTSNPESHTGTGSVSPITLYGLTNGTSYTFTVHATNAIGNSVESSASNAVIPNASSVDSSWKYRRTITIDNSSNASDLTDYQVKVSLNTHDLTSQDKMNFDRSDVRFVDPASNQILNHWTYFDWKKTEQVLLDVGQAGSWETYGLEKPIVEKLNDGTYGMWYHANSTTNGYRVGYATSPDAVTWTKYSGNPVLSVGAPGEWDDNMVAVGAVMIMPNGTYYMWYDGSRSGGKWQIGLATSADGINWTKNPSNPILSPSATGWDSGSSFYVESVIQVAPSTYYMYYDGSGATSGDANLQTGLATSSDGINWTKSPSNPVFTPGPAGSWDANQVEGSYVYKEGNKYVMAYGASTLFGSSVTTRGVGIGFAQSDDGVNWTRYPDNPVLKRGGISGTPDLKGLMHPFVMHIGDESYLYHIASDVNNTERIYLAKMSDTADFWVKVPSIPAHSTKTIDLYYGNPAASDISNGDQTFELFDNFSGTSLNSSKWDSNGTVAATYGEAVASGVYSIETYLNSKTTFGTNYAMDARISLPKESSPGLPSIGFKNGSNPLSVSSFVSADNNSGNTVFNKAYLSAGQNAVTDSSFAAKTISSTNLALNVFEIKRLSDGSTQFSINGGNSSLMNSPLITDALPVGIDQYYQGSYTTDWILVRKSTDTEPVNLIGAEIDLTPAPTATHGSKKKAVSEVNPSTAPVTNEIPTSESIVAEITQTLHDYNISAPTASFTMSSDNTTGSTVTFDASGSTSNKGITKYEWDFGDGTQAEGMKVEHEYQSPGRYTVTLTVTDRAGNKNTTTQTVDIKPAAPTITNITAKGAALWIEGKSDPGTTIYFTIHSNPFDGQGLANKDGYWTYFLDNASDVLGAGDHTIFALAAVKLADNTELKGAPSKTYDFKMSVDNGKLKVEMQKTRIWQIVAGVFGLLFLSLIIFLVLKRKRARRNY